MTMMMSDGNTYPELLKLTAHDAYIPLRSEKNQDFNSSILMNHC